MQSVIPTAIITTKRCISLLQSCYHNLSPAFTVHSNWETFNLTPFWVFNKYLPDFVNVCTPPLDTQQTTTTNPNNHLIYKTSINRCRDLIPQRTSFYNRQLLESRKLHHPSSKFDLQHRLDVILDKRISMVLFTMSRTPYEHRFHQWNIRNDAQKKIETIILFF